MFMKALKGVLIPRSLLQCRNLDQKMTLEYPANFGFKDCSRKIPCIPQVKVKLFGAALLQGKRTEIGRYPSMRHKKLITYNNGLLSSLFLQEASIAILKRPNIFHAARHLITHLTRIIDAKMPSTISNLVHTPPYMCFCSIMYSWAHIPMYSLHDWQWLPSS